MGICRRTKVKTTGAKTLFLHSKLNQQPLTAGLCCYRREHSHPPLLSPNTQTRPHSRRRCGNGEHQCQLSGCPPTLRRLRQPRWSLHTDEPKRNECQMRSPWARPVALSLSRPSPTLRRRPGSGAAGAAQSSARWPVESASLCCSSLWAASSRPCSCCFISGHQEEGSLMTPTYSQVSPGISLIPKN